ncbi:exonuclease 3'-5' domain-containing protein 2 [Lethenteron reissneri]|uniref:exonuclease 3'-5' domain-containing protein 2 n=1 Tax=Lethenteron reissneri TaxID=7753 RepID=UPI002AB5F3C1|nr:exonuclease 3'-5' domain-containing protein 2 [Lethenteron reissneri]
MAWRGAGNAMLSTIHSPGLIMSSSRIVAGALLAALGTAAGIYCAWRRLGSAQGGEGTGPEDDCGRVGGRVDVGGGGGEVTELRSDCEGEARCEPECARGKEGDSSDIEYSRNASSAGLETPLDLPQVATGPLCALKDTPSQTVALVETMGQWNEAASPLQRDLATYPVLGMDCEWVVEDGRAMPVALLQLASASGYCVLVRLCPLNSSTPSSTTSSSTSPDSFSSTAIDGAADLTNALPSGLRDLLASRAVLKAGVGVFDDARRLERDRGVAVHGCVDLRHLAIRHGRCKGRWNGLGLKALALAELGLEMEKSAEQQQSDWEAPELSEAQVKYAAHDAQVSVRLFLSLLGRSLQAPASDTLGRSDEEEDCSGASTSVTSVDSGCGSELASPAGVTGECWARLLSRCAGLVDVPFKKLNVETVGRLHVRSSSNDSTESGDAESVPAENGLSGGGAGSCSSSSENIHGDNSLAVIGIPKVKKEGFFSPRKSPLYDNCLLKAPDGQPLSTCDRKKAQWYLNRGIAELESQEPMVVRLVFEPAGRPDSQHDYYLGVKRNVCVVCGRAESYVRKSIVPHEYRRHFPQQMKDHQSHDVLLLCTPCHAASAAHDLRLKRQLADECCASESGAAAVGLFGGSREAVEMEGPRVTDDPVRRNVRSAARALLRSGSALPPHRRRELLGCVRSFYAERWSPLGSCHQLLQEAAKLETRVVNGQHVPHGLRVVQAYMHQGLPALASLERRWRQHFLDTMLPCHLPPNWSVTHNHDKLMLLHLDPTDSTTPTKSIPGASNVGTPSGSDKPVAFSTPVNGSTTGAGDSTPTALGGASAVVADGVCAVNGPTCRHAPGTNYLPVENLRPGQM